METTYGFLSVVPAILVISLALITKQTLSSLLIGVYFGSIIIAGWNPLTAFPQMISEYIIPAVQGNSGMIVLVAASGGFIFLIKNSGAAQALGEYAAKYIKTRKGAQTATFFGAFAFIYTEPHLTLGVIMRPITEKMRVSRVKLAYMCDSLATIASLSPVCACGPFISGLIAAQLSMLMLDDINPWSVYAMYIPYNFYAVFAILTVLIVVRTGLDVGPMYEAEQRAIRTGALVGPDDTPIIAENPEDSRLPEGASISLKNFAIPMITLFVTLFSVIFWSGDIVNNGLLQSFLNANITLAITCGMAMGSIAICIVSYFSKICNFSQAIKKWQQGVLDITSVSLILVMAWSLSGILNTMGVKEFMATLVSTTGFPPALIPAVVFLLGAATSFATGSSWGTWSILIPIVFPIAYQFDISMSLMVGAVVSGGLFGDHCSPISDTTIMSSTVSACDHVQHVRTQLPYGLTVGVSAFCGFLVSGFTGLLLTGFLATLLVDVLILLVLNRRAKARIAKDSEFVDVA